MYNKDNVKDLTEEEILSEIERLEKLAARMNTMQLGKKIALNSSYGATSNRYFTEYFDQGTSCAITSSGQNFIQWIAKKVNDYFQKILGIEYAFIIYSDTDSNYIDFQPLVDKMFPNGASDEVITKFLVDLMEQKVEPLLIEWAEEMSRSLNCKKNQLVFKLEKVFKGCIFVQKKRYVLATLYKEGSWYDKPKINITGLEAVRSTYKKQWRDWLEETYEIALLGTEEQVHKKVAEVESTFRSLPIHEIGTVTSVNDIEKYSIDRFTAGKGAPKQVKAAINYNKLKYHYKVGGLDIQSTDKIQYVGLIKNNPYGIDVIGFPEYLPDEFGLTKYIDYSNIFNKNYLDPMTNFLRSINWTPKKRANAMSLFG